MGKSGLDPVIYPVYQEPFSITLILNNDAFPILREEAVRTQAQHMVQSYVDRINGYRLIAEQRAAIEIDKNKALYHLHELKRKLGQEKAKLTLRMADLKDDRQKPKYSAEYKLKAAIEAALISEPPLIKLDEELFQFEQDVRGYVAKIEAMKQLMSAHREEIIAIRDTIAHLVNSGLVAVAGIPMEEENFAQELDEPGSEG